MEWPDHLAAVQARIDRAQDYVERLRGEVQQYVNLPPYVPDIQNEEFFYMWAEVWGSPSEEQRQTVLSFGGTLQVVASEIRPLPADIPLTLGDIVHNLRSSLDNLAWVLADRKCGLSAGAESPPFPIFWGNKKPSYFEKPTIPQDLRDALHAVHQHHDATGQPMRRIRSLNNDDKHRMLNVVLTHSEDVEGTYTFPSGEVWSSGRVQRLRKNKVGLAHETLEPGTYLSSLRVDNAVPYLQQKPGRITVEVDLRLAISLNERSYDEQPAVSVVEDMQHLVDYVRDNVVPPLAAYLTASGT